MSTNFWPNWTGWDLLLRNIGQPLINRTHLFQNVLSQRKERFFDVDVRFCTRFKEADVVFWCDLKEIAHTPLAVHPSIQENVVVFPDMLPVLPLLWIPHACPPYRICYRAAFFPHPRSHAGIINTIRKGKWAIMIKQQQTKKKQHTFKCANIFRLQFVPGIQELPLLNSA